MQRSATELLYVICAFVFHMKIAVTRFSHVVHKQDYTYILQLSWRVMMEGSNSVLGVSPGSELVDSQGNIDQD